MALVWYAYRGGAVADRTVSLWDCCEFEFTVSALLVPQKEGGLLSWLSIFPPPCAQGTSLTVPAGTSCAFVGTSGSGKSTIMRLLFRFYDVSAGSVRVGGADVRDLKLASLRSAIAQVPQVCGWPWLSHL